MTTTMTKTNNELTRDDLHANVFNHLKGKEYAVIVEIERVAQGWTVEETTTKMNRVTRAIFPLQSG